MGTSGLPLAYVTREDIAIPAPADDPGFGIPDFTSEMIRRGDHTDDSYEPDNTTVWTIIRHVTHGGQGWSWVSKYARSTNGRAAYFALKAHYLGDAYVSRIRSNADKIMEAAFYDGKSRIFTFERFCELLIQAYNDVEETGEEVTEARKMRTFLWGCRIQDVSQPRTPFQPSEEVWQTQWTWWQKS